VMDAVSSLTASQKALDTIRALPGWLLTAVLVSAALFSLTPLHQDLPQGVVRWLPLSTIVIAVAVVCRLGQSCWPRWQGGERDRSSGTANG